MYLTENLLLRLLVHIFSDQGRLEEEKLAEVGVTARPLNYVCATCSRAAEGRGGEGAQVVMVD